jgi:uncharacterized protein (TIGR00730 family)
MTAIRAICVYCGSSPGTDPSFLATARAFGKIMAENKVDLVYGGGSRGLMGELARSVHDHGGKVIGVIPEFLQARELAFSGAQEMIVTDTMHTRKQLMFDRADAFVALPGGIGTLEELIEQLTWSQLGQHKKPIALANVNGFWDPLCVLLEHMKTNGFIHAELSFELGVARRIEDVLPLLQAAATSKDEEEVEGFPKVIEKM